eukprot:6180157-Pleurochrysis_carterae.AAC.2
MCALGKFRGASARPSLSCVGCSRRAARLTRDLAPSSTSFLALPSLYRLLIPCPRHACNLATSSSAPSMIQGCRELA